MDYPPNDDNQSQYTPPQPNTSYPPQQPGASYPLPQPPYPYQPPPPPVPPKKGTSPALWVAIGVIVVLFLCIFSSSFHTGSQNTSTQDTNTATTQPQSVTDQVKQALAVYKYPPVVSSVSSDSVLVTLTSSGDTAGEAETLALAINAASSYQKTIWQANIVGLSEVTVVIVQTDYPDSNGNPGSQDIVKAIVYAATGTTINWNSGTPAQQFQQFDVKWVIGQGVEP